MRNLGLGVGLFSVGTMASASLWFANAPDLPLGQPTYSMASAKETVVNEVDFIKRVKASLKEDVSEPPVERRWYLQNASLSKGASRQPVESRGLLHRKSRKGVFRTH